MEILWIIDMVSFSSYMYMHPTGMGVNVMSLSLYDHIDLSDKLCIIYQVTQFSPESFCQPQGKKVNLICDYATA